MHDFIPGQRWISDTESELGLGTVRQADFRRVTFHFPASNEIRVYAKDNAPLTRVRFSPGDLIENLENCFLKVDSVAEDAGLLTYTGTDKEGVRRELPEAELSHFIQFSRPQDRLLAGRFDSGRRFALRYATLQEYNQIEQSPVWGLCGARINLIPHQLYIAHRAAGRYAPRILLADETGLGKTIEAGLILHRQLLSGRAQRVLLVVPESLLHQWLVEMLRRFNLRFSIFDEERCQSGDSFASEQLVLCSLDFFIARPEYHVQALAGEWDLLVVDEAHHLEWSEAEASPAYVLIEQLAERTKGVLLLTATPEQLGQTGHFARLRLLDPDRFYDFNAFCQEQSQYEPTARAVEQLLEQKSLSSGAVKNLMSALEEAENRSLIRMLDDPDAEEAAKNQARERLISQLLDRHGTGRVLFRNTRAAVQGFPDRRLHIYPLPFPDKYRACIRQSGGDGLYPEQTCRRLLNRNVDTACRPKAGDKNSSMPAAAKVKKIPGWQTFDPRVTWLMETLDALKPDKVLVICASAQTALELEQVLRTRAGIPAAAFHEGMNIVRRDRVAAWFAEQEDGAQVLVCSEIGSEGRNFQFAHHLVLFDLPLNPDLLEQRIGRLDRIGQKQTIQIHVPYLRSSAQEILFRWYHEGLNAFAHTCPSAAGVFSQLRPELLKNFQQATALLSQYSSKDTPPLPEHDALSSLINSSRALYQEINERLKRGHDRLLELNSCRKEQAEALRKEIVKIDRDSSPRTYMEQVFDCFGVDFEEHSALNYIVKPGNHMLVPAFPELPADGVTVTFDRTTALAREDMQFLTWEHPMVRGAMDLVLTSEHGNAAVLVLENPYIKQGSLLLETIFLVECSAPKYLQTGCYLPPTVLRFLLDQEFRDLSEELPCERLTEQAADVSQSVAAEIVRSRRELIREVLARSEKLARLRLPGIIAAARQRISDTLNAEIKRLLALQQINLNVRTEEIDFQRHLLADLEKHIQAAQLRLDAVRVAITR